MAGVGILLTLSPQAREPGPVKSLDDLAPTVSGGVPPLIEVWRFLAVN
jgi:hypothetical protein